jgi:hypothetical protein
LDFANANFDRDSARQAAMLAEDDKALLAQIDISKVDVSKIKFTGIDISKIDLAKQISAQDMKKIDFSKVNFGLVIQSRIDALKPFIAKEGIRYQLALQKRMLDEKRQPNAAETKQQPDESTLDPSTKSNEIRVNYLEDSMDTLPEQKNAIVQALSVISRKEVKLRLWVNVPTDDIYLKRTAYARLIAVRALAVDAGFAPARISVSINTVPGLTPLVREMTVHVEELKP